MVDTAGCKAELRSLLHAGISELQLLASGGEEFHGLKVVT